MACVNKLKSLNKKKDFPIQVNDMSSAEDEGEKMQNAAITVRKKKVSAVDSVHFISVHVTHTK